MRTTLDARSRSLRATLVRECLLHARRGHLGPSFSVIDILRVLYDSILRHDPLRPDWPDRDRMILSKGHGGLALYTLLADKGYFPTSVLNGFTRFDGRLGVHPDHFKVPGVEASTGSLGHGPSIGVGMALAARIDRRPSKVWVVVGDGEAQEGSVWEACLSAGKHKLDNFAILVDYNHQQACGPIDEVQPMEPFADKFRAFGFATAEIDGHDVPAMESLFARFPLEPGKPTAVICHTVKGKGIPATENNVEWHHQNKMEREELEGFLAGLEATRA
jgi:transketolase